MGGPRDHDDERAAPVVIKIGGDVLNDEKQRRGLCKNIDALITEGERVVVLHGGGPQVSSLQRRLGLTPNKVGGRRITSEADLQCVVQAICGEVNVALCALLQAENIDAFGCHGASGPLVWAKKRAPAKVSGGGDEPVDFGEVGDVVGINADLVNGLLDMGVVPVIATLGCTNEGRILNINGDTTAVRLAQAVHAKALILATAVGAIYEDLNDKSSRIEEINRIEATSLIQKGVIQGGMIPKVEEALAVLGRGVDLIAIASPANYDAFASALCGNLAHGTRIVAD